MNHHVALIAVLLIGPGMVVVACGPGGGKVCPQYSVYYEPAPRAPVTAAVMVNQCTEKGPNTTRVGLYQSGAEMQLNTYQWAVSVRDKSEGKQLQKHGGPFVSFEWKSDSELVVRHAASAELVNARSTVEGGAIRPVSVKYVALPLCPMEDGKPASGSKPGLECMPDRTQEKEK